MLENKSADLISLKSSQKATDFWNEMVDEFRRKTEHVLGRAVFFWRSVISKVVSLSLNEKFGSNDLP